MGMFIYALEGNHETENYVFSFFSALFTLMVIHLFISCLACLTTAALSVKLSQGENDNMNQIVINQI